MCSLCDEYGTTPRRLVSESGVEMMRKTLALIDAEASDMKRFDMDDWGYVTHSGDTPELCGTSMCFAGWGVIAAGGEMKIVNANGSDDDPWWSVRFEYDGEQVHPESFAREKFDLPDSDIFYRCDLVTTADLRVTLKEYYGVDV